MRRLILAALLVSSAALDHPLTSSVRADDWPQWLGPNRDAVWHESGIIDKFPDGGPKVRWRAPIGAGYTGPAVAEGRVYAMDRKLAKGASNPKSEFQRGSIPGTERVICIKESDGSTLWVHEYDCAYTVSYPLGPRTTPVVKDNRVYTLGTEGNLYCLDAESGKPIWAHELKKEYNVPAPMWGFSAHPLLDGDKLICMVGGDGTTTVAFDKGSGKELWRALSAKEPGYVRPRLLRPAENASSSSGMRKPSTASIRKPARSIGAKPISPTRAWPSLCLAKRATSFF